MVIRPRVPSSIESPCKCYDTEMVLRSAASLLLLLVCAVSFSSNYRLTCLAHPQRLPRPSSAASPTSIPIASLLWHRQGRSRSYPCAHETLCRAALSLPSARSAFVFSTIDQACPASFRRPLGIWTPLLASRSSVSSSNMANRSSSMIPPATCRRPSCSDHHRVGRASSPGQRQQHGPPRNDLRRQSLRPWRNPRKARKIQSCPGPQAHPLLRFHHQPARPPAPDACLHRAIRRTRPPAPRARQHPSLSRRCDSRAGAVYSR